MDASTLPAQTSREVNESALDQQSQSEGWSEPEPGVWSRPLGMTEQGFYWDDVFAGTANMYRATAVRVTSRRPLVEDDVRKAWIACKLRHPLVGAVIDEINGDPPALSFVVRRQALESSRPEEVAFTDAPGSIADVDALVWELQEPKGPRCLSRNLLARLYVRRAVDSDFRPGEGQVWHFVFVEQHCITDGVAYDVLNRYFFEQLANIVGGQRPEATSDAATISRRLALVPSSESLNPSNRLPRARRRWRTAIARTILAIRMGKLEGGHTLPRRVSDPTITARSAYYRIYLSPETTAKILNGCRQHRMTFNAALGVLEQLAHARVLHRLRQSGEISDDEWRLRLQQPMHMAGPLNLRPSLDPAWKNNPDGGMAQNFICINFLFYTLPFLPRAPWGLSGGSEGGPVGFESLLSEDRFWYRASIVAHQLRSLIKHPLFVDVALGRLPMRVKTTRANALRYRKLGLEGPVVATTTVGGPTFVASNGGSSLGDISAANPRIFKSSLVGHTVTAPPTATQAEVTIEVVRTQDSLHCRPGELYCGASTDKDFTSTARPGKNVMAFYAFFDENVYEKELVHEWIDEVRNAAEHYFARYSTEWPPVIEDRLRL